MRANRGITLVALVVTIVVMLLLAAVSINMAFGDDGIFAIAKQASLQQRTETVKELITAEMSGFVAKSVITGNPLNADEVINHFNKIEWVSNATDEGDNTVRIISTDKIIVDIKFTPFGGFELIGQGEDNGEPYPTIEIVQEPLTGTPGETIKLKVTASVETRGETTGISYVENVTTGDRQDYVDGGVVFEVTENGDYTFKAVTNKEKAKTKTYTVSIASAGLIDITINPATPRNTLQTGTQNGVGTGPVVVTITYGDVSLTNTDKYQYRVGTSGTWQRTSNNTVTLNVSENTEIVASYYDGTNTLGVKNYAIQNVDNIAPTNLVANVTGKTSNSLTVTATADDTASSGAGSDIPGILRYEYSIDNTNWQEDSTITNLNHGTKYEIYVKAIDKAGNEVTTTVEGTTEAIPDAIGFNASTTTDTNQSITLDITWPNNAGSYTKQYKKDNGSWTTYTTTLTIDSNCTIYARLVDSNNQTGKEAEYPITWIDKTLPGSPTFTASGTTGNEGWYKSNVTVTIAHGTDTNVSHTEYSVNGGTATTGTTVNVTAEGTTTITAYTYDKAGNKSATEGKITIKKDSVGPTFSGLTSTTVTTYNTATFTSGVSISDTQSGVTSSTSFTYSPTSLSNGTNTITYTATDKAGNTTTQNRTITYNAVKTLVSQVTASNYGNTVTYSANGITDWKIFYKDSNYVYIIASDYVPNSKVATSNLGMTTNGSYNVYWSSFPDTSLSVGTWQLSGNSTFGKSQNNYYATSGLMNTSKWSSFVNSTYADQAIGGPTLDMYIASWNAKYTSNKLYLAANSTGYYVGTSSNPTSTYVQMSGTSGYSDTLYYPHTAVWNNCYGYWLASPSAGSANYVMVVYYNGLVNYTGYDYTYWGVRPVVRLKSTVGGTLSGTNWTLQ